MVYEPDLPIKGYGKDLLISAGFLDSHVDLDSLSIT